MWLKFAKALRNLTGSNIFCTTNVRCRCLGLYWVQ